MLEPVRVEAMPDLPLLIGPAANRQVGDAQPAARRRAAPQAADHRRDLGRRPALGRPLPDRRGAGAARGRGGGAARDRALRDAWTSRARCSAAASSASTCATRGGWWCACRASRARASPTCSRPIPGRFRPTWRGRFEGSPHASSRRPATLVAALDVGSSKVCALIAEPGEDGQLKILGTGQRESRGVKRGFIADMEKSEIAIREAVEQAERIAGTNIDQVFVGFSAPAGWSATSPASRSRSAAAGSPTPTSTPCSTPGAR